MNKHWWNNFLDFEILYHKSEISSIVFIHLLPSADIQLSKTFGSTDNRIIISWLIFRLTILF